MAAASTSTSSCYSKLYGRRELGLPTSSSAVHLQKKMPRKPILNWANFVLPNILQTVWRNMIRFLTELLVHRTWFGQFDKLHSQLATCNEMQASARTCGRRAADDVQIYANFLWTADFLNVSTLCVCVHEQTFFLLFSSAHFIADELQSGYSIILALYVHSF